MNVLFDITILAHGIEKSGARSGIYFVALNLLKNFLKRNDISLYFCCDALKVDNLEIFKRQNPDFKDIPIIIVEEQTKLQKFYKKIKDLKKQAGKDKKYLNKIFYIITGIFYKLLLKLLPENCKIKTYPKSIEKIDAFFSPMHAPPKTIKKNTRIKKYIVLHDAIPVLLSDYLPKDPDYWFIKLFNYLNTDDKYFTVSEYTKKDFMKLKPFIKEENFTTTLLAVDENFRPTHDNIDKILQKYNVPQNKKYVFSLCTLEPRKNLIRAVKTFIQFIKKHNIDDLVFVLGGGHWDAFMSQIDKEIENLSEYKHKIIKAGYVDDEDLAPLYSNAEWFVYTSQYEGFGLPPLEAMSCGCPVISSNNSSLPEVVGNTNIMIDWDNDEQHIKAYEDYYFNPELRKTMSEKGLEHSKSFSWEKCANIMVDTIINN